jgi:cytochrome c-type biogenesis protein CcmH/NrfG
MNREVDIYTETMAKVYAAQGHWSEAAGIYRHLLALQPQRKDLVQALAEAESMMTNSQPKNPQQLVPLFEEWIELLFKVEKLKKLKKLKRMH